MKMKSYYDIRIEKNVHNEMFIIGLCTKLGKKGWELRLIHGEYIIFQKCVNLSDNEVRLLNEIVRFLSLLDKDNVSSENLINHYRSITSTIILPEVDSLRELMRSYLSYLDSIIIDREFGKFNVENPTERFRYMVNNYLSKLKEYDL